MKAVFSLAILMMRIYQKSTTKSIDKNMITIAN